MNYAGQVGFILLVVAGCCWASDVGSSDFWKEFNAESIVAGKFNKFGFTIAGNLFERTNRVKKPENIVVCPFSIGLTLAEIFHNAEGRTKSELSSAFKWTNTHLEDQGITKLLDAFKNSDLQEFQSVSKIFYSNQYSFKTSFSENLKKTNHTELIAVDFSNAEQIRTYVNQMFTEYSQGETPEILSKHDSLNNSTNVIFVNKAFFQGYWVYAHQPGPSVPFHQLSGNIVQMPSEIFSGSMNVGYNADLKSQFIKLDYMRNSKSTKHSKNYLLTIMPMDNSSFSTLNERLSSLELGDFYSPYWVNVNLHTPKPSLIHSIVPLETGTEMEKINSMMNENVNSTGMNKDKGLVFDKIIHYAAMNFQDHSKGIQRQASPVAETQYVDLYLDRPLITVTVVNGVAAFFTYFIGFE